jgi:hypothetical protein
MSDAMLERARAWLDEHGHDRCDAGHYASNPEQTEAALAALLREVAAEARGGEEQCSFCGLLKAMTEGAFLIKGPGVSVCVSCVALFVDIIAEREPGEVR